MPADALSPPPTVAPKTIFAAITRDRIVPEPWVEFIFEQAVAAVGEDGVTPVLNSVGQPLYLGSGQQTILRTSDPAKLAELEGRAHAYHQAGKLPDDTDATLAYEELEACRAVTTLAEVEALGYTVSGTLIPWT